MNEKDKKPCSDKLAFDTQNEARNMALAVDWQRGSKLKVYKCRYCQLWHLSSQPE